MSRLLEIFFNPDPPPLLSSILCWFKNYNPRAVAPHETELLFFQVRN
jgi:hypothetical protein